MKKRIISFLLVLTMISALAACGNESSGGSQESLPTSQNSDGRTKITLASFVLMPYIEERINTFNSTNKDFYVEVIDYSQYNTADDYSAGETKLKTDILGGNAPDMIELGKMPIENYTNKNLLEDLAPYIEADPDLGAGSLVDGIYNALLDDTGLHRLAPSVILIGLCGKASLIGDASSWNFDEMRAFLEEHSEVEHPFLNMPVYSILPLILKQYVNDDGTCRFDSEEFISLLSFIAEYEKKAGSFVEDTDTAIMNNEALLRTMYLNGIDGFAEIYEALNGDLSLIGNPTQEGSGNIADFQFSFGMFADANNKEGCWEFMRTFLDKDYQSEQAESEIPVLKSVFEETLASSSTAEEVKNKYRDIVNATTTSYAIDSTIFRMVHEQLDAVLADSITAEEAAKRIQSKASIYLSENQ